MIRAAIATVLPVQLNLDLANETVIVAAILGSQAAFLFVLARWRRLLRDFRRGDC